MSEYLVLQRQKKERMLETYAVMTNDWQGDIPLGSMARLAPPLEPPFDWGVPENEETAKGGVIVIGRSASGSYQVVALSDTIYFILDVAPADLTPMPTDENSEKYRALARLIEKFSLRRFCDLPPIMDNHRYSIDHLPGTCVMLRGKIGLATFCDDRDKLLVLFATPIAHFRLHDSFELERTNEDAWLATDEQVRQFLLRAYGVVTFEFQSAYAIHTGAHVRAPIAAFSLPTHDTKK